MYSEYYSVKQALKGLQAEPDIANRDPAKIKDLFFRRLYISYSENVKPENVKLQRRQDGPGWDMERSEEHTSELQSLMRISYAVFCLKTKNPSAHITSSTHTPIALPSIRSHTTRLTPYTPMALKADTVMITRAIPS